MSKREQELNLALESMHFGFRAMTYKPDQQLARLGLARIHHRLLYFLARHPGCSVNELLQVMRISKQYLHQPLKKMIEQGYVSQRPDPDRERKKTGIRADRGATSTFRRNFQTNRTRSGETLAPGDGLTQRADCILRNCFRAAPLRRDCHHREQADSR
jgi:hypothetical protein